MSVQSFRHGRGYGDDDSNPCADDGEGVGVVVESVASDGMASTRTG